MMMQTTTETQPRARRLIVTAREARALRDGATQVRRVIDVPKLERALTLGRDVLVRPDDMLRLPLVVGGVYWIAEAFADVTWLAGAEKRVANADGDIRGIRYRATWEKAHGGAWRPASTMPAWASRMSVVVEAVRVERVQEATEADARAMGFPIKGPVKARQRVTRLDGSVEESVVDLYDFDARASFCHAWDAEHPRAPWAANLWVAVGTVRRVEG